MQVCYDISAALVQTIALIAQESSFPVELARLQIGVDVRSGRVLISHVEVTSLKTTPIPRHVVVPKSEALFRSRPVQIDVIIEYELGENSIIGKEDGITHGTRISRPICLGPDINAFMGPIGQRLIVDEADKFSCGYAE